MLNETHICSQTPVMTQRKEHNIWFRFETVQQVDFPIVLTRNDNYIFDFLRQVLDSQSSSIFGFAPLTVGIWQTKQFKRF